MAIDLPQFPSLGLVYKASNGVEYIWDGTKWSYVSSSGGGGVGGSNVSIGIDPPLNPDEGDLWFNTIYGILYVWYSDETQNPSSGEGQWVDARPSEFSV